MATRFASAVIWSTALTYLGFAIWLGGWPQALLGVFGIEQQPPAMLTEIRAFYGGLEFGIAAVMVILWLRSAPAAALLVGGLPLGGAAAARCLGMLVDGYSSTHAMLAGAELSGMIVCVVGLLSVGKSGAK
ncbi:MAG: DUF4345 family protein [Pirellulaceae bacterium]|nr:DUF4345 family protein [Pirellulaceae bacterium]